MLVSQRTEIKLQNSYLNVSHVFPAYGNTFAILAQRGNGVYVFVHCHKSGKVLFEEAFEEPVIHLALWSQYQAIVLLTRQKSIRLIHLYEQKTEDIKLEHMVHHQNQLQIFTFNASRMFCISEQGENRLKLTYYAYPLTKDSKPIAIYQSGQNQWTPNYIINKGNQKSLMVWWRPRPRNYIQIKCFKINHKGKQIKPKFFVVSSLDCVGWQLRMEFKIARCWELNESKFLVLVSSRGINLGQTYNSPIVLDHKDRIISQFKSNLPRDVMQCQIQQTSFGYVSMLRSFRFLNGKPKQSAVCYINNLHQEIIAELKWQCSHRLKFYISGHERDTLIECEFQNNDVQQIMVTKRYAPNARMLALHFLLEMYEDFDDDLLKEAVQFLPLYGEGCE